MFIQFFVSILQTMWGAVHREAEHYKVYARFTGMKGPINCMQFDQTGELLASGGDDETVRLWELASRSCVQVIEDHCQRWGQITCLAWIGETKGEKLQSIAFATGRGFIALYKRANKQTPFIELSSSRVFDASDPVEAIAYDNAKQRIVATSHHGRIAMYEIGRSGTLVNIWTSKMSADVCIPRSVHFYDGNQRLLVFVLETGEMSSRDAITGNEEWRKVLKSGIGSAAICYRGRLLLIDNLATGFDLYDFPRSSPSFTFRVPMSKRCIKGAIFAEQASVVVCGSDHGKVYIFSTGSSEPMQVLRQSGSSTEIQSVQATSVGSFHLIAAGTSSSTSEITVWRKQVKGPQRSTRTKAGSNPWLAILSTLVNLLVVVSVLAWSVPVWSPLVVRLVRDAVELTEKAAQFSAGVAPFVTPEGRTEAENIPAHTVDVRQRNRPRSSKWPQAQDATKKSSRADYEFSDGPETFDTWEEIVEESWDEL